MINTAIERLTAAIRGLQFQSRYKPGARKQLRADGAVGELVLRGARLRIAPFMNRRFMPARQAADRGVGRSGVAWRDIQPRTEAAARARFICCYTHMSQYTSARKKLVTIAKAQPIG